MTAVGATTPRSAWEEPADPAPRLAAVNGLRGIAIIAVLYHHLLNHRLTPLFGAPNVVIKGWFVSAYMLAVNGWLGVNLFFVLSGLVLQLPYSFGKREVKTARDVGRFYARRAHRLLPVYYVSLVVYVLAAVPGDVGSARHFEELAKLVTFGFAFSNDMFMPPLNVVLWSLGVEVWFSVLFPALVLLTRRIGIGKVLALSLVLSFGVRLLTAIVWDGPPAYHLQWKDGLFGRLDDFVAGMAIAEWLARRQRIPGALASVGLVALGFVLVLAGCLGWDNVVVAVLPYSAVSVLNLFILAGLSLIVAGMVSRPPVVLRFALANRPLQLAGAMCYSLYLWHMLGTRGHDPEWPLDGVLLYIALVFVLSALSYRFIEFPEKPWRALFLGFPRAAVAGPPGAAKDRNFAPAGASLETVPESSGPT